MSLNLTVQFSKCPLTEPTTGEAVGTVNHTMFYVHKTETETVLFQKYHRVHSTNGPNDQYFVESSVEKFGAPRRPVGEGFKVPLTGMGRVISAQQFAKILAKLPPPELNKGACQWWVLRNLTELENSGYVMKGTVEKLLADPRMDSTRLVEYQSLRDELQATLTLSLVPESLEAEEKDLLRRMQRDINGEDAANEISDEYYIN